jgi:hypothetical protein
MPADFEQLNLKLPPKRYAVLKAAVFTRDLGSIKELVMPLLEELIAELEQDEGVRLALQGRSLEQGKSTGVVTPLSSREKRS